jgi:RNA polymerase sigma-70 factor (ECF subfamily)
MVDDAVNARVSGTPPVEPDAVLVGRARQGDREAFGCLVRRYMQAAYAVALARLGEPADAEDVCQDAMITALKRLDECRQPEQFASWLLTIVRNRARDLQRYRSVREGPVLEEETAESTRASPEQDAQNAETRRHLMHALSLLTVLQREVLLLFDFEGWSHREIAERLGVSEGSARVHLFNGRKALRARLADRYQEES